MNITANGKLTEITANSNINDFLKLKELKPETVIIEHNYEIIDRSRWQETILKENDNLEVLKFVGGG
jgi:sulfur carrier protein